MPNPRTLAYSAVVPTSAYKADVFLGTRHSRTVDRETNLIRLGSGDIVLGYKGIVIATYQLDGTVICNGNGSSRGMLRRIAAAIGETDWRVTGRRRRVDFLYRGVWPLEYGYYASIRFLPDGSVRFNNYDDGLSLEILDAEVRNVLEQPEDSYTLRRTEFDWVLMPPAGRLY